MSNMENRLNKCVFTWAKQVNVKNWSHRTKSFLQDINMHHLIREDHTKNISTLVQDMNIVLHEMYEVKWWAAVNRHEDIRGNGHNKLRTYRTFKQGYEGEAHIKNIMPYKYRSAFSKFRCGVAPIHTVTGRYENLAEEQRLCVLCDQGEVESEQHTIMRCTFYENERADLTALAIQQNDMFLSLNEQEQFIFLMSSPNMCFYSARACHNILIQRREFLYQ
jgi:hypothetical protein